MNQTAASIVQKGKVAQLEPNIMSAGEGSQVFAQHLQKLYMKNELDRNSGENFLEFYRGMRA
jgi:Tfp pilus assembly pilus retraction ATPase PilT